MVDTLTEEKSYLAYAKIKLQENIAYYQKELHEIPRRHTNVLQGDAFLVESLMSIAATRLRQLEKAQKVPYFGRIDFLFDEAEKLSKVYIGKTGIMSSESDIVAVDWRTPVCSLYYDSELGPTSYEVSDGTITGELSLKRQIIIDNAQLVDVRDIALVAQDQLLQSYLEVHADNRMKNIVASIQKEQHRIIRQPLHSDIIVQGVAGSGKTSVALHRIAYLVYNESANIRSNQFLVIGPNKYFLDYISNLLPDLEVDLIDQVTFLDIAKNVIGEDLKISDASLNLENHGSNDTDRAILSFKSSLEYKEILGTFLIDYLADILDKDITLNGEVVVSAEDVRELFEQQKRLSISDAISFVQNILVQRVKKNHIKIETEVASKLYEEMRSLDIRDPKRDELYDQISKLKSELKTGCKKTIQNHFKKANQKPTYIYKEFLKKLKMYIGENHDIDDEQLSKSTLKNLSKKTAEYEDLAALMYIKLVFGGSARYKNYRQVVLDEAQDLGLFHFDVVKQLFDNANFSIFGDLNQAIYSYRSIGNWENLNNAIFNSECIIETLDQSYRTTHEIMADANYIPELLSLHTSESPIRHGAQVEYVDFANKNQLAILIAHIKKHLSDNYKTIAIITRNQQESVYLSALLQAEGMDINCINPEDQKYPGGVSCVTSYLAKGLEFDAAIIADASSVQYDSKKSVDMHLLYVAMTRPLHALSILYDGEISEVLSTPARRGELEKNSRRK